LAGAPELSLWRAAALSRLTAWSRRVCTPERAICISGDEQWGHSPEACDNGEHIVLVRGRGW